MIIFPRPTVRLQMGLHGFHYLTVRLNTTTPISTCIEPRIQPSCILPDPITVSQPYGATIPDDDMSLGAGIEAAYVRSGMSPPT